jgi:general secretion pathway protein D
MGGFALFASFLAPSASPAQIATTQTATTQFTSTRPTTGAHANGNGVHGVTTQPGGGLILNFKDASIESVLDELSATAGFIVVKIAKPEGRVTLVSKQVVSPADAVSLLNTVLKSAGYAAVQQGRILKILSLDDAKVANIPVHIGSDPTKIDPTDELITQVIPLRQADATQLKNDLAPLVNPAGFTANASSNALVVTDTAANIRRLVEIVSALDNNLVAASEVIVVQLNYASASGTAKLINDLFGDDASRNRNQQQGGFGGGFPFFRGFGGGGGGPGGQGGGGQNPNQPSRQQVKINASADDRTNTIVVTGPQEILATIKNVIKELDANPASDETVFIYRLKNAQSDNLEYVLNYLFNSNSASGSPQRPTNSRNNAFSRSGAIGSNNSRSSGSSRTGSSGSSGFGSNSSRLGSSGSSSPFGSNQSSLGGNNFGQRSTSGFGGFGSPGGISPGGSQTAADLAGQVNVIADPDTNSLLIRTAPKNYDRVKQILDELDRAVGQVLIKVLIAEVTHDNSIDVGAELSVLNLRASGNGQKGGTNFGLANLQSGLVVSILETDLTATLRALETEGKLDVLSRPYILASDNQLASITVGQEVPLIDNSRITDTGQTINTLRYEDVGILLDVVPHINPNGLVILDVAPEISALTGQTVQVSDTASQPIIAKRSAQSHVAIQDGHTIVIGGLMEDRKTSTISKVPILGNIPIIGELFKRTQDTKTKTELLIFLTPHVAAQPEDLKAMSKDELKGTKLTPNAVYPGAFDEHMKGLERGATTQPSTQPVQEPAR